MKPGNIKWAENALYAAGPDVGSKTKSPPTAAQEGDGYYPTYRPAPQIWNYMRWAQAERLKSLALMRLSNIFPGDMSAVAANGGKGNGVFSPDGYHDVVTNGGAASAIEVYSSKGGVVFDDSTAPVDTASISAAIASDGLVERAIAGGATGVWRSSFRGAWSHGATWADAIAWQFIEHDHVGLWLVARDRTTPDHDLIKISDGPATAWSAPATPPGWAALENILAVAHSHHPSGMVYDQDPGNPLWVVMGNTQVSTSSDGDVWTAASAHGLGTAVPSKIAYSAAGTMWISALIDGGVPKIARSQDGVTWTASSPFVGTALTVTDIDIASDGFGDWLVAMGDGSSVEFWGSVDNGETWFQIWPMQDTTATPTRIKVWFGGGRFHVDITDGSSAFDHFVSLRADE